MERRPAEHQMWPGLDEHLIREGQRAELVSGALVVTPPAHEPHATQHARLGSLLCAHVADGYQVALDMLTRVADDSDFAPDASVYPVARDPDSDERQLEVMAFEIVGTQRRSVATSKAQVLYQRGVPHIYCIDLNTHELLEWSGQGVWTCLPEEATLDTVALAAPLLVRALLDSAEHDNAVATALLRRNNPVLVDSQQQAHSLGHRLGHDLGLAEGHDLGLAEGLRRSVVRVYERRFGVEIPKALRARIDATRDAALLEAWHDLALTETAQTFAERILAS